MSNSNAFAADQLERVPFTSYQQAVLDQNANLAATALREQRKIRVGVTVLAVVAALWMILSLAAGVYIGVSVAHAADTVSAPADTGGCASLGGTDGSC